MIELNKIDALHLEEKYCMVFLKKITNKLVTSKIIYGLQV